MEKVCSTEPGIVYRQLVGCVPVFNYKAVPEGEAEGNPAAHFPGVIVRALVSLEFAMPF